VATKNDNIFINLIIRLNVLGMVLLVEL